MYKKLEGQMNFEIESAYIYMGMASYLKNEGYDGMSHFMMEQAKEEMEHAMKFYEFLNDVGEHVVFGAIPAPKAEYKNVLDVFKSAFEHEKEVTRRIHELYWQAEEKKNLPAMRLLDWYVHEQVEEEANFDDIVTKLERAHENFGALYILDQELGRRQ